MKKILRILPFILCLSCLAGPDILDPAAQGLSRQTPYSSEWSRQFLTNTSAQQAGTMLNGSLVATNFTPLQSDINGNNKNMTNLATMQSTQAIVSGAARLNGGVTVSNGLTVSSGTIVGDISGSVLGNNGVTARKAPFFNSSGLLSKWHAVSRVMTDSTTHQVVTPQLIHLGGELGLFWGSYINTTGASTNWGAIRAAFGRTVDALAEYGNVLQPTPGTWDSGYIGGGSIYYESGTNYYFYFGGTNHTFEGRPTQIGLATSTDGTNWTKWSTSSPLISTNATLTVGLAPSSVVKSGNTYYCFVGGLQNNDLAEDIYLYTAPSVYGPWSLWSTAPVVIGPTVGGYEIATTPSVFALNDRGWGMMYYIVPSSNSFGSILSTAFSDDLTHWTTNPPLSVIWDIAASGVPQRMDDPFVFNDDGAAALIQDATYIYLLRPEIPSKTLLANLQTANGIAGQVITASSSGAPTWQTPAAGGPIGDAGVTARKLPTPLTQSILSKWHYTARLIQNSTYHATVTPQLVRNGGTIGLYWGAYVNTPGAGTNYGAIRAAFGPSLDTLIEYGSFVLSPTPGTWDSGYIGGGSIFTENGTNYYFYFGGTNKTFEGRPTQIGLATSTDGTNWTKWASTPIIPTNSTLTVGVAPSCMVKYSSTYYLFVGGLQNNDLAENIYLFTSSSIYGPWSMWSTDPVVKGPSVGGYEIATTPSVFALKDRGWGMIYYTVPATNTFGQVESSAFSDDLLHWKTNGMMSMINDLPFNFPSVQSDPFVFEDNGPAMLNQDGTYIYLLRPEVPGQIQVPLNGVNGGSFHDVTLTTSTVSGNGLGLTNLQAPLVMGGGAIVDAFATMNTNVSDHIGQLGVAPSGFGNTVSFYQFQAATVGTGSNAWRGRTEFPNGISSIGSSKNMPAGYANTLKIYQNGNSEDSRYSHRADRSGSGVYHYNYNPFGDGNWTFYPIMTTNLANASANSLTNIDGDVISQFDQFGLTIGVIPKEYYVGERNQAGSSDIILGVNQWPFNISMNTDLDGSETNVGQHSLVTFSQAGTASRGVHIPHQIPYVYSITNVQWRDVLFADTDSGVIYLGGGFQDGIPGLGPTTGKYKCGVQITSNACWNADVDTTFTFDYGGRGYTAFALTADYTWLGHTTNSPFTIGRFNTTDLRSGVSGLGRTIDLRIDQNGAAVFGGSITGNGVGITNLQPKQINYTTNGTPTGAATIIPDFSQAYSMIATNAAFTFAVPTGVDAGKTLAQTTVVIVTNTTAAAVAVTAPASWHQQGTWYVTNATSFTIFQYGQKFTNATALPLW